jgi:hypothetical protein
MRTGIGLQRATEEKARQPETKLGATSHTWHDVRLRSEAEQKNPKTHTLGSKQA